MKIPLLYEFERFLLKYKKSLKIKLRYIYHRKHMKKYSQIIMLGKNCEVAFYFFRQFGFIDSNLFAWAYIREEHMISVLKHPDILLNGELCPIEHGMIKHIPTEFLFHGRSNDYTTASKETIQSDIDELKSRLRYLIKKFTNYLNSNEKKLFIFTLRDNINHEKYISSILEILKSKTKNFNILCIMEEKQHHNSIISMQNDTIYFRFVNHFADPNCVTSLESGDPKGWKKIFNEFGPECLKKSSKHFKFDSRD